MEKGVGRGGWRSCGTHVLRIHHVEASQWNMEPAGRFEFMHDTHKTINLTKSVAEANRLPSKSPSPPSEHTEATETAE